MNEYYSQKANPDPAITKYKNQGISSNNALTIDAKNNVLKSNSLEINDRLPFVSLSGAI